MASGYRRSNSARLGDGGRLFWRGATCLPRTSSPQKERCPLSVSLTERRSSSAPVRSRQLYPSIYCGAASHGRRRAAERCTFPHLSAPLASLAPNRASEVLSAKL